MIAFKFLRSGRTGPFSAFRWPEPGVWVEAPRRPATCRSGVHGCRIQDLPWWLAEELWEIELGGAIEIDAHKVVASRGRLRGQIEAWTPACAQRYAEACAWRARDRAVQALSARDTSGRQASLALVPRSPRFCSPPETWLLAHRTAGSAS